MTEDKPLENAMWQPVVAERRWNWFVSGLVNFLFAFLLALIIWYVTVDPRFDMGFGLHALWYGYFAAVIAGFGILAVVVAIWFDHWPYGRFRDIFSYSMWGIILNIVLIVAAFLFFWFLVGPFIFPMFSPYVLQQIPGSIFASDASAAFYLSASAMGTILSCGFSFAAIWVAGGMYWPFTDMEPKKRGFAVFCMAAIITAITWFILYWPYQQLTIWPLPAVSPLIFSEWTPLPIWTLYATFDVTLQLTNAGAFISLNFTQWVIVFGLLTLMAFEYRPWIWAGRQPWIGIAALFGCVLLGALFSLFLMPLFILPIFFPAYGAIEMQVLSTYLAVWILLAIFMWTQFFSNKPTRFNPSVNDTIRVIIVVFIGVLFWILYPMIAPILIGESMAAAEMNPIRWALWLLWFMMIVTYLLKRWPGWRIRSHAEGKHRTPKPEPEAEPELESGFE